MRHILACLLLGLALLPSHATARPVEIVLIYGQGGPAFSEGFSAFGNRLSRMGYHVTKWWPRRPDLIIRYVNNVPPNRAVALVTYSLGVNSGVSWVAPRVKRPIDLLVGYDGTVNAEMHSPLSRNVKKALAYWQRCYIGASLAFGRARFTGPQVTTYSVCEDHLAVQFNPHLHARTVKALADLKRAP